MLLNLEASSFGFSITYSGFSLFWAAFTILVHTSGHTFSSLVVAWIFVNLTLDHTYPLGGFAVDEVNFVNPFQESDKLRFTSTLQKSSTRFSCDTSRFVWVDLVTSMYSSGTGNVFVPAHQVKLNVHCDDDKWNHLELTKSLSGLQRRLLILSVENLPVRLEVVHWDLHSLQDVPVLEQENLFRG